MRDKGHGPLADGIGGRQSIATFATRGVMTFRTKSYGMTFAGFTIRMAVLVTLLCHRGVPTTPVPSAQSS